MATRLLVTSAGTGSSNNLISSLRAGQSSLTILGGHDDPFVLQGSDADRRYLLPSAVSASVTGMTRSTASRLAMRASARAHPAGVDADGSR